MLFNLNINSHLVWQFWRVSVAIRTGSIALDSGSGVDADWMLSTNAVVVNKADQNATPHRAELESTWDEPEAIVAEEDVCVS